MACHQVHDLGSARQWMCIVGNISGNTLLATITLSKQSKFLLNIKYIYRHNKKACDSDSCQAHTTVFP